jgi:hypothetical protein
VLRERPWGELGPEKAKEFRDTGKDGGEEHTQKGAECAERSSQIHVLVVSAENGGKQLGQPRIPALPQGHSGTLAQVSVLSSRNGFAFVVVRSPLLISLARVAALPVERVIVPHCETPIFLDGAAHIAAAVAEARRS